MKSKIISKENLESIKSILYDSVNEWVGFDIPTEGTNDYAQWQSMLLDIDDIKTLKDVVYCLKI